MNSLGGTKKRGRWHLEGLTRNHTRCREEVDNQGSLWRIVRLWDTDIVKWSVCTGIIELDSGGYRSVTTRRRMNEVTRLIGLGYYVHQTKHKWYVLFRGIIYDFVDHMRLYGAIEDRTRKEVVQEKGLFG